MVLCFLPNVVNGSNGRRGKVNVVKKHVYPKDGFCDRQRHRVARQLVVLGDRPEASGRTGDLRMSL